MAVVDKLNDILSGTGKPETDEEDLGKSASRPVVKYVPAFHVKGCDGVRSFEYAHLGFKKFEASGATFVLEFHEPSSWRLTVEGRNLWPIYNYLILHRLEWIGSVDRDFENGKLPVIARLLIESIQDEEQ